MNMLEYLQKQLEDFNETMDGLSEDITALLSTGKTLDDEDVQSKARERQGAYDSAKRVRELLTQEQEQQRARAGDLELVAASRGGQPELQAPRTGQTPSPFSRNIENRPMAGFGEFLSAVAHAAMNPQQELDQRLLDLRAYQLGLGEAVPSEGGFLIQQDFTDDLLRRVHDTGKLVAKPRSIELSERSNGIRINAIDEASRVDGSRLGGVRAYWTPEAGTLTASKPTFRQIELRLHKLTGLYYATDEELQDTVALESTVAEFFAEEFGFKLDDALIRGGGAGEPLGILGHAGTVNVAKESGQAAATLLLENVQKMYARMWARSIEGAEWLINQDVWPQIFQLNQAVGTGGVPVFLPAGSVAGQPFNTLYGLPITPIEQCETLGTSGDIILANFRSGYIMARKGGIAAAVSIHVQFLTDESVFRFIMRTDGQPISNVALTPYKGTQTQSSFVTLATRA